MSAQKRITITLEQYEEAREDYLGYCIKCGAERDSCEPDARKYPCEECGEKAVYGADEFLVMGLVE